MLNKKVLAGFAGLVMFAVAATALAANNPGGGTGPIIVDPGPVLVLSPCPDGWHMLPDTKSGDDFACIPTKTTRMIECPVGMDYYDNGCEVGCQQVAK